MEETAGTPEAAEDTAPASGSGRSGHARVDRLAVVIAFLVATVSIVSAVVAGRAAVWSSTASDIDSLVLQESIEREQLQSDLEGSGAADLRLAARYDAAQRLASAQRERADALRATDPVAAARADLDAQAQWDIDLALWRFFRTTIPTYDDTGALVFDVRTAIAESAAADARLSELRRSQTPARAQAARDQTLTLVGVAVLFVAALFVLTLAEVWPGRSRWAPLLVGLALAAGATAVTVAVEPATALLIAGIVAVAAAVLAVALVALERRQREAARVAAAGGPAPEPEAEGGSTRFRGAVAVVLAAATLLGASVGYLQGRAGDAGAAATHEAQDQALLALAEHQRTMGWATAQVEVWSSVVEARAQAVGARQLAAYLTGEGDADGAADAAAAAERADAVAAAADGLTLLSDDHPDGPRADPGFPSRFLLSQQAFRAARVARQDLANEANAAWGAQVAGYVAVLATIAIAAYLLGLSLVLRTRRLRGLFAVTGLGLVLAAAAAAGLTALAPSTLPTITEQAAIAAAYARATVLDEAAQSHAEHTAAVAAWRQVVALHPTLARAHVELASELFAEGSPQTVGYSSIATLEATAAALAELETATSLGWDDLGTRGDTGFYRFLVGLRDPAGGASAQAVHDARSALELSPDLPVLRFNIASALLADGRIEEARAAYDAAIAAVGARDDAGAPRFAELERIDVSSGAITDLELIAAARADQPELMAALAEIRTAVVNGMGDPVPAAAADSPATVSGLGLFANPERAVVAGAHRRVRRDAGRDDGAVAARGPGGPRLAGAVAPQRAAAPGGDEHRGRLLRERRRARLLRLPGISADEQPVRLRARRPLPGRAVPQRPPRGGPGGGDARHAGADHGAPDRPGTLVLPARRLGRGDRGDRTRAHLRRRDRGAPAADPARVPARPRRRGGRGRGAPGDGRGGRGLGRPRSRRARSPSRPT